MIDDTFIISDIINEGFTVTENAKLIKQYKKLFPNYHVQKHMRSFFFMDLDRIASAEPFHYEAEAFYHDNESGISDYVYHDGSFDAEYVRLIFKPSIGDLKHRNTRIITMKTFKEIKELLIKRNRYDILLNLDAV